MIKVLLLFLAITKEVSLMQRKKNNCHHRPAKDALRNLNKREEKDLYNFWLMMA